MTLWMGHKLAVEELDLSEATLPLADLSGIQVGDALRMEWPRADAIVGNPPFHGDRSLRRILGDDYVEWLKREFRVGVKDYCVYWFRKTHDALHNDMRAGLVGTNSISQNRARSASLDYIVANGGVITSAVSTQDWPGAVAVDVSIVNWIKDPHLVPTTTLLDGAAVIIRAQAKHARESSTSYHRNPRWWQFLWPRPVFRTAAASLTRYIAGTATGKRILFCWCSLDVVASNSTNVFALDGDFAIGVLTSRIHANWARLQSSTLEDRIRYTPTSAFETFPWPPPNPEVAILGARLITRRSEICIERNIGLTKLYNQMDDGAWADLRELHRALDEAVAVAYGWPRSVAHDPDETNRRLLELNRAIAAGEVEYRPFGS